MSVASQERPSSKLVSLSEGIQFQAVDAAGAQAAQEAVAVPSVRPVVVVVPTFGVVARY